MSYRVHTTSADSVAIQWGTAAELDEAFGFEHLVGEGDDSYIVFNDTGNQEAWVMSDDTEALRKFAEKILRDLLVTGDNRRVLNTVSEWTDEEFLLAFGFERTVEEG